MQTTPENEKDTVHEHEQTTIDPPVNATDPALAQMRGAEDDSRKTTVGVDEDVAPVEAVRE